MRKKVEFGYSQYGPGGTTYARAIVDEDVYLEWMLAFEDVPQLVEIQTDDPRVQVIYMRQRKNVVANLGDNDLGRKWIILNYPEDGY